MLVVGVLLAGIWAGAASQATSAKGAYNAAVSSQFLYDYVFYRPLINATSFGSSVAGRYFGYTLLDASLDGKRESYKNSASNANLAGAVFGIFVVVALASSGNKGAASAAAPPDDAGKKVGWRMEWAPEPTDHSKGQPSIAVGYQRLGVRFTTVF